MSVALLASVVVASSSLLPAALAVCLSQTVLCLPVPRRYSLHVSFHLLCGCLVQDLGDDLSQCRRASPLCLPVLHRRQCGGNRPRDLFQLALRASRLDSPTLIPSSASRNSDCCW